MGQSEGGLDELGQLGHWWQQAGARPKGRSWLGRAWLRAHEAKGELKSFIIFSEFLIQTKLIRIQTNSKTKQTTNQMDSLLKWKGKF
jgi:hypothetical protein